MKELRNMIEFTEKEISEAKKNRDILVDYIPVSLTEKETQELELFSTLGDPSGMGFPRDGFYIERCNCHPDRFNGRVIEISNSQTCAREYLL